MFNSSAEVNKPVVILGWKARGSDKADFGTFSKTEQYLKVCEPVFTRACWEKERCIQNSLFRR
jgi:hypothetical protein